MNIAQASQVLALISLGDRRHIDQIVIAFWHDLIGDLDYDDAIAAVKEHRKTTTDYLEPAHVIAGVRQIRRSRLDAAPPPLPDVDPDDVVAYQAERRRLIALIADGHTPEPPRRIEQHTPTRPTEHRSTP